MTGETAVAGKAITTWLEPLRPVLDPCERVDWARLTALGDELQQVLAMHPVGADLPAGPERSHRLRVVRRELAVRGHLDSPGQPSLFQLFAQFACGYCDIDLRDATGLGHGSLIARRGGSQARRKWLPRLRAGELAGIAITESHGGSRPAETRTSAVVGEDGTWLVSGCKTWISRLTEAAVFVVFFRAPDGRLAAAAVDATQPGLHRQPIQPTGLAGWTWGVLELDAVRVGQEDVLRGDGMALLREHFAGYRPLVTATALGGASAVFDAVAERLSARHASGELPRLRDSALISLGRAHVQLVTSLLGAVMAEGFAESGRAEAELWGAATKAHGIDTANSVVGDLALLLGASGFRADCQTSKIRRDLSGLLFADGIHDSLYRTAGKHHATGANPMVPTPRARLEPIAMTA